MPPAIDVKRRTRYDALRRAGNNRAEASRRAGVSYSWAKDRDSELKARGDHLPKDSIAPAVTRLRQQGRGPKEIADILSLPKHKVDTVIRRGVGFGQGESLRNTDISVGPIAYKDLADPAKRAWDDFEYFRARYLGSVSTPWQVEAAEKVRGYLEGEEKTYVVVNCPQGAGKTRLFSHDIPAWLTVRNRALRGIVGSLSQHLSHDLCDNLKTTFERTIPAVARDWDRERGLSIDAQACLASEYGYFKPQGTGGGQWRRERFVVAQHGGASTEKEPTWAGFSREAKFLGWRVDFMVWDDLVNTDMLRNQDRAEDLYRWWDTEAESRIDPGGLVLLVGQRLRSNDIYRYCLDKRVIVDEFDISEDVERRPQYHHIVYKAHYEDRCSGKVDDHLPSAPAYDPAAPDKSGCMLDPKRIKWRDIQEKKAAGTYEVVFQQEDTDPADVLVQREWVNGGVGKDGVDYAGCWDRDRRVGQLPYVPSGSFVIRYMTVDPSPTKWWYVFDILYVLPADVEPLAGRRYVIQAKRAKMGANDLLDWSQNQGDKYVGLAEEWVQFARGQGVPIEFFIMEKNAAQRWAMQYEFFNNWKMSRGVNVLPHETMNNKTDDELGVEATIPNVFKHGRVRLPGGDTESRYSVLPFVQEVTTYPNGSTTDGVMSFWFGEYNLQHLVARRNTGSRVHRDIPSWMRER